MKLIVINAINGCDNENPRSLVNIFSEGVCLGVPQIRRALMKRLVELLADGDIHKDSVAVEVPCLDCGQHFFADA